MCEFITAGGFNHADLPNNLLPEAQLMRDALLSDLSQLPYHISTTLDARLSPPKNCNDYVLVQADDDVWQVWATQIKAADAVWLIAPETNHILQNLTQIAALQGALVLGCGPASIKTFSSKLATFLACKQAGIATIPTYSFENWPKIEASYIAKPDDGAGCDDTFYFETANDLSDWIVHNNKQHTHVVQPYLEGIAASISCVMHGGTAQVLSCNQQLVKFSHNKLQFKGIVVNAMQAHWVQFELLAQQVAQLASKLVPDLAGYIGIDVIVHDAQITLVEINPRLTTSYCGLREATGLNPAELIINTLTKAQFKWPVLQRNVVNINA